MSTMLNTAIEFPVSIELGKAEISRTAAEAVRLTFHANQVQALNRIQQLGAAMVTEMEKVRDTPREVTAGPNGEAIPVPFPNAREASVAITSLQTAVFWCAQAVIKTI